MTLLNILTRRGPQPSRTPLSRDDHSNASENRSLFRLENSCAERSVELKLFGRSMSPNVANAETATPPA